MNINRDNYEEYFLLYADDELTDSEKAAVLLFVKNNKDLEEEFRMIHHTISRPDVNVKLDNKSFLLKNTSSFINEKNYEDIFVLYHDNELNENERLQTEEFLALNNDLKNEFDLIALARLTAESNVVFTNKNSLYKREKNGKLVPLLLWRILAAAIFIGFVLWIINFNVQKLKVINQSVAHNIPVKKLPLTKAVVAQKKDTNSLTAHNANNKNSSVKKIDVIASQKILQRKNNNTLVKTNFHKEKTFEKNTDKALPEKANDEELALEKVTKSISNNNMASGQTLSREKLLLQKTAIKNPDEALPVANATTVSYNENVQSKSANYVFYDVTSTEFKKTKVGGFLKKVRRVIARNNPIGRLLSGNDRQVASN